MDGAGDDPTTEELRAVQADREEAERERPTSADEPDEERAHERRADSAAYLREKLDEQAEAERVSDRDEDVDRLGRPRRQLRRERPARPDRSPSAPSSGKERLVRAIARAAYKARREVRRRRLLRPATSSARGCCTPTRTRSTTCRRGTGRAAAGAGRAALRADRAERHRRPGRARRRRPAARGPRPAAVPQRGGQGRQRPHDELDGDRAGADARVGAARLPDLDADAALEAKLWEQILHVLRLDSRRPGRRVARARGHARRGRGGADDRAALRRAALRGAGHRPDGRAAAELVAGRRRASRPIDGIVHMPNLPTEEVFTTPDPERVDGDVRSTKPLVPRRHDHPRARGALRGRPRGAHRRRRERRRAARATRSATRARRAWARSRSSTARAASARSTRSSSTRCSTRTRRRHIALGSAYLFTVDDEADQRARERRARSTSTS